MHIRYRATPKGFTIVELMIVIVVIAILASIAIVGYRGIQESARNTTRLYNAKQVVDAAQLRRASFGELAYDYGELMEWNDGSLPHQFQYILYEYDECPLWQPPTDEWGRDAICYFGTYGMEDGNRPHVRYYGPPPSGSGAPGVQYIYLD